MNDTHMTPDDIKQLQKKAQQEYIERTKDKDVDIVLSNDRPSIKVPVQVAVRKDVQVSDLPAVWLFAFGNLTTEEYNNYLKQNSGELTINEITASRVLEGVLRGDREDKQIYWKLQERILSKPNAVSSKSSIADLRPNAIMSKLLDEIESNVFKDTSEGEVIEGECSEGEGTGKQESEAE